MIRIGILGTDNSHSIGFSQLFNVKGEANHIPGAKVVAVFGVDEARNREVAQEGNIPLIVKRPKDMLGKIDAAIVDFRHGGLHYKYAAPFIGAGVPTFVDKPMTVSAREAKKLVALARRKRTPITSFSTVRLGPPAANLRKAIAGIGKVSAAVVTGPGSTHSEYGGVWFYGVHCVELMLEVFGNRVESVRAVEHDGSVSATVMYRKGPMVTVNVIDKAKTRWDVTAFGASGQARYERGEGRPEYYYGMKMFLKMVRTGKPPIAYEDLVLSVRVLEGMEKSMKSGGREVVLW